MQESPAHSVFVSQLIGFVRNMKIFCSQELFWFQSHWSRDILHRNLVLILGNSMVVIQTLFTNLTLLCHICWRVCSPTVTCDWFPANFLSKSWRVPPVGAGNAHYFRNNWIHSVWGIHDFTHSLYIHYIMFQSWNYVYGLMISVYLLGLVWLF